jgi:hypothetical protein
MRLPNDLNNKYITKNKIAFIVLIITTLLTISTISYEGVVYKRKSTIKKIEVEAEPCAPSKNEELNNLLIKYFKDCKDVKVMWSIAQAESTGQVKAVNKNNRNGSWDCGYLQTNTIHRNKGESKENFCNRMHNLEENIKQAKKIKDKQGLTAWVTYNSGAYLAYMK